MRFAVWLEALGNFHYVVPHDREQQLFDFYMLNYLRGRSSFDSKMHSQGMHTGVKPDFTPGNMNREDELDYALQEVADKLLPYLKKELLDAVFLAVCYEVRHMYYENTPKEIKEMLRSNMSDALSHYQKYHDTLTNSFIDSNLDNQRKSALWAFEASGFTKTEFMRFAKLCFDNLKWDSMFGGGNWSHIVDGWEHLYKAKSPNDLFTYIDHIYDLAHNSGSVLDKVKEYQGEWLIDALNLKAKTNNPYDFISKVSRPMKDLALRVIKQKFGTGYDNYLQDKTAKHGISQSAIEEFRRGMQQRDGGKDNLIVLKVVREFLWKYNDTFLPSLEEKARFGLYQLSGVDFYHSKYLWHLFKVLFNKEIKSQSEAEYGYLTVDLSKDMYWQIMKSVSDTNRLHYLIERATGWKERNVKSLAKLFIQRTIQKQT